MPSAPTCQRASCLLASNPSAHPPTRASMRRPTPFTARMGPSPLGRAGAIHGLGCPSIHLALRGPDACTGDGGSSARSSSGSSSGSMGPMGPMGSKQSSPKSQTHQQGSHLLISLERSGVKNC